MVKAVTIFLLVIVVLAMFGKLGWLGSLAPRGLQRHLRRKPAVCNRCGRHVIGSKGCDCRSGSG